LADEPTGNLDQKNAREILDILKLCNRSLQQTILLITHDERTALEADRIVTIEDGRIVAITAIIRRSGIRLFWSGRGGSKMWKEYCAEFIRQNRVSCISVVAASFISA